MAKILIVYYSKGGTTRTVAQRLARESQADLVEIEDVNERKGVMGYMRSVLEAAFHVAGNIRVKPLRDDYDLVVIGTPIWAWNMSSPARAFVSQRRGALRRVAFFCTYGGSGATKVLHDLETLSGLQPVGTLALRTEDVKRGKTDSNLLQFAAQIKIAAQAPAQPKGGKGVEGKTLAHS